jgi:hypothetical protein
MASQLPPEDRAQDPSWIPCPDLPVHASNAEALDPEHREQIRKLLDISEEDLLYRLGREIAPLEGIAPTLWFVSSNDRFLPLVLRLAIRVVCRHLGPRSYVRVARQFLRKNRTLFRLRICIGWDYCKRRHCPQVQDPVQLVSILASFVSHLRLGAGVPSELVAAILVKQGLDTLCRCKAERAEGGQS